MAQSCGGSGETPVSPGHNSREDQVKLYNSVGPNPQVVRMFLAEKGLKLDTVEVDLMKGENRQEAHLKRNPAGQMPSLELDDGTFVNEVTAICEYIEEKHPKPALIGTTAEERAETRMWTRRFDENVNWPLANGFRYGEGAALFKGRIPVFPEASAPLKALAQDRLKWFDGMIGGRQWIAGDRFTLADIMAFCFLSFGAMVGQPINPEAKNLLAWFDRVKARPSASA
jgi:glutathione S-transferase